MSHLVRFRTASGEHSTEEVPDLEAAVARVEALRNDERADDVRVFVEVPLRFETYVKVSLADDEVAPEPVAAEPAVESEPVAAAPESAPELAVESEPAVAAEPEPEPVAAEPEPEPEPEPVAAAEPPPPPPAPMDPPPGAMLLTPASSANGDDSRTGLFGRS